MKSLRLTTVGLLKLFSSISFFWLVIGLLVLQALWIAASALYPMPFDEEFHLGLIRLYADHNLPFWGAHPSGGDAFGALTRDPSYLFHYLLSFPYLLLGVLTDNEALKIMMLRLINIGLFAWGLVLFRQLLLKTRASAAMVHLSLLVVVLVPIVPFLAAHINYDNLLFPLAALALLWALRLRDSLSKTRLDFSLVLKLASLLMLACLVKYAFLPIAVAIVGWLIYGAYSTYKTPAMLIKAMGSGGRQLRRSLLIGLSLLTVLTAGLFVERFGINLVKYHTPVADCDQVLNYDHCQHYGVWIRDHNLEKNKGNPELSAVKFTNSWLEGMWYRSFFSLAGPTVGYQTNGPLVMPAIAAAAAAVAGLLALLITARRIWHKYSGRVLGLFAASSLLYVAVLWVDVYMLYLKVGKPVAINGRYLILILPIVILVTALAINQLLASRQRLKLAIGGLVLACFLWGGGALTFILRSNDSWYWPHTPLKPANHVLKDTLGPLTPGYYNPHLFRP